MIPISCKLIFRITCLALVLSLILVSSLHAQSVSQYRSVFGEHIYKPDGSSILASGSALPAEPCTDDSATIGVTTFFVLTSAAAGENLYACIGGSWEQQTIGPGAGTGDITSVFNCTSGGCPNLAPSDGQLLDFSAVTVDSQTEGLILPGASDCDDADLAINQVCVKADPDFGLWLGDPTDPVLIGPTPIPSMNQVATVGRTIFGVDSFANAIIFTDDGTNTARLYWDSGEFKIDTDCDGSPCLFKISRTGGTVVIDDAFNVTLSGAAKELSSYPLKMPDAAVDGTQCTKADAAIGDALIADAATCAIHTDSEIQFTVLLGDRWDAGLVIIEWYVANVNASPAGTYQVNWSAQCRGLGEVIGAFGSSQPVIYDFDNAGTCGTQCAQNASMSLFTSDITPVGGCEKGDYLILRGEIDASSTTTQASDIRHMGGKFMYLADDWSDD